MHAKNAALVCGFVLLLGLQINAHAAEEVGAADLKIEAEIKLNTDTIAFGHGALWASRQFDVIRVEQTDGSLIKSEITDGSRYLRAPVIGSDAVWLPDVGGNVITKINPDTGELAGQIAIEMLGYEGSIAVGAGSLWVVTAADLEKQLARIDEKTGQIAATLPLPGSGAGVSYGHGFAWVTSKFNSEVYKINPETNSVDARIELEGAPVHVATDEYAVWVRNERDGSVVRIDPETHAVTRIETALFGSKGNIVAGGGYIWVLAESRMGRAMVAQIDPQTDLTVRTCERSTCSSRWLQGTAKSHSVRHPADCPLS